MKNIIIIIFSVVSFIANAQTKLDTVVFNKINDYRVSLGLNKVTWDSSAFKVAEKQALYMKTKSVVGHSDGLVNEVSSFDTCNNLTYFDVDRIADDIISEFKKSPKHNAIIVSECYKFVGVSTKATARNNGFKGKVNYEVYTVIDFK